MASVDDRPPPSPSIQALAKHAGLPIGPTIAPRRTGDDETRIEQLAAELRQERPELALDERLRPVQLDGWLEGGSIVLDDLSSIRLGNGLAAIAYLDDRARLRAGDGDCLVTRRAACGGYAEYCTRQLRLGAPTWLSPEKAGESLAMACWNDRRLRRRLVSAIRRGELVHVHPHMGNQAVWELAISLQQAARRPLGVIAPPPAVAEWSNDKLAFARTVARLLGPSFVPRTQSASNLTGLARLVRELSERTGCLAIKVPDSAGGAGNYVLECERFRDRTLTGIRRMLHRVLRRLTWEQTPEVLVGYWETSVLAAPSAQLWIPPLASGRPVVEGIFLQSIEGTQGTFTGTRPAEFDARRTADIAHWSWMLGRLYQRLGYVGRCSFDMLLVGKSLSSSRVKFIECNGRWGGTSLPMTLVHRLRGPGQPFVTRELRHDALACLAFEEVRRELDHLLYDANTEKGQVVLFAPRRQEESGAISALVLGDSQQEANQRGDALVNEHLLPLTNQYAPT
jgi:hypothetical protein